MWHPLRLAEDYAMADILSGGRVIFGVARGYHTREVETFGSPLTDQDANRELFEEGVDVIFKAFNEERFSHKGKYYTLPARGAVSRLHAEGDHPGAAAACACRSNAGSRSRAGSQRAFDFMAKHGICGVIGGGSAEGGAVDRHMTEFRAAYARRGIELEPGERLSLGYQFHIAESREAAMRAAATAYEENMKMFGELRLVRAITDEQIAAMRDPRAGAQHQAAAHRGCGEGGRLPGRHAGRHHRAAQGGREALSGPRARQLHHAARHAARRHARAARPVRQGSDAGLQADEGARPTKGERR